MKNNIILLSDSYKATHWKQYPPGTEKVYSYFESRGPVSPRLKWPDTVFFGLQYYLKEYLAGKVVTKEKIDEAEELFAGHFNNPNLFNRAGWEHILDKHDGHLPVVIKAVPEGTVSPRMNVLMTIENTDPACYWLTNYLETLLVQVWYATTIATQSREMKMLLLHYLEQTGGDKNQIDFKMHDFGFRGVSSVETAGLGACAHLISFKGTDTLAGLVVARDYYGCPLAGYSIPAAEHSTITAWGVDGETAAYENMLRQFPDGLVAVVSDSYDIVNACKNIWGGTLKDKVLARNGTLVVRPDSGNPDKSILSVFENLGATFGTTLNSKGFKVLNNVRVIQGDGIAWDTLEKIMWTLKKKKWSLDNIAFGSGGGLLQRVYRDTLQFAFKCSNITVNGEDRPVFKAPKGDKAKISKKGRMKLVLGVTPKETTIMKTVSLHELGDDLLLEVFRDGKITHETTLDEVRQLAWAE